MCLFAMLFMEFFGLTKYGVYGASHVNFRDYGNALLLLVRASTGEAWVSSMDISCQQDTHTLFS